MWADFLKLIFFTFEWLEVWPNVRTTLDHRLSK